MRHCVDTYSRRCQSGGTLIVSVRKGNRRVATAELALECEGWRLVQVKGFTNVDVPTPLGDRLRVWALTLRSMPDFAAEADGE